MTMRLRLLVAVPLMLSMLAAIPARSHEGHDHGAPEPVASDPNLVVRSASSDTFEVVMKYRSVRGMKAAAVTIYLSDFATNAPIDRARVSLRMASSRPVSALATVTAPGVYEATMPFDAPGRYTLILAVAGTSAAEFAFQDLPMGENLTASTVGTPTPGRRFPWWWIGVVLTALIVAVAVIVRRRTIRPVSRTVIVLVMIGAGGLLMSQRAPAKEAVPPAAAGAPAPVGLTQLHYVPKESQFFLGIRTIVVQLESLRARINGVGHVVPESGALAKVAAPRDGKLEPVGRLRVGDRVRQGQVIANLLVIDQLPIRAPIAGLVAEVHFAGGQWVRAGDPLLVILDERQVRVELPLFGENLNLALRTRDATVTSTALPGMEFEARVLGLAPTLPEPTGETRGEPHAGSSIPPVMLTVVNRGGLLRPGMLVETSLELPTAEDLIAVPESAVIYQESGAAVFVHTAAEVFEQRPVRVVGRYGNRVGLAGDIRSGDRIVVERAQAVVSAPPVTIAASADSVRSKR